MNSLLLLMGSTVAATPPEAYWMALIESFGLSSIYSNVRGEAIAINSDGSCVITGRSTVPVAFSPSAVYTAKLDSDGTIAWQRAEGYFEGRAAATDAAGNAYVNIIDVDAFGYCARVIKYDSAGTILWKKNISIAAGTGEAVFATGITVSLTGYVYAANRSAVQVGLVEVYDSSGARQSGFTIGISNANIGLTSTDEILLAGTTSTGGVQGINATKLNSSGTSIVWQKKLVKNLIQIFASHFTSAGDTVLGGYGSGDNILALYNSSGVLQWQKTITLLGYGGIASDSSGNIYACGRVYNGLYNDIGVIKFSPSGVVIWQRKLHNTVNGTTDSLVTGACVVGGALYLTGTCTTWLSGGTASKRLVAVKIPTDGSLTGTYGPFEYTTMSLTVSAGTAVESTDTLTVAARADTPTDPALVTYSISASQTLYPM